MFMQIFENTKHIIQVQTDFAEAQEKSLQIYFKF